MNLPDNMISALVAIFFQIVLLFVLGRICK